MKYKFAEEMKQALLVGRAGRHDVVRIDGEERMAWHCSKAAGGRKVQGGF